MVFLFLLGNLWASSSFGSEFSLELDRESISAQKISAEKEALVSEFLKSAERVLPPSMKANLTGPVTVEFKSFGKLKEIPAPVCAHSFQAGVDAEGAILKAGSLGETASPPLSSHELLYGKAIANNRVQLNALFLPEIVKGSDGARTYPCGHKNFFKLALATLVHELGHLYDDPSGMGWSQRVSSDRQYQRLSGWSKQSSASHLGIPVLLPKNRLRSRSPDSYEFTNIREHFAVNLEYFLLDPEYGCRRPALNEYWVHHFSGFRPHTRCQPRTEVFPHFHSGGIRRDQLVDLNPERVYSIHYLQAAPGPSASSRWGHSMFRVVVCAPDRPLGEDCLKDIRYHWVVSYQALVSDAFIDGWKGLSGQYPSQVFIYPLKEAIEYYNKIELRDLTSIPLDFTSDQKQSFVYRVLEQYWEYVGAYYFFSNNCSSEAGHLLKGILPSPVLKGFFARTPSLLQSKLDQIGLLKMGVLKNPEAVKKGFLFPSSRSSLESAFSSLRSEVLTGTLRGTEWENFSDYELKTDANERASLIAAFEQKVENFQNGSTKGQVLDPAVVSKVYASFYYLESHIELIRTKRFQEQVYARLQNLGTSESEKDRELYQISENHGGWSLPASGLVQGYGIPVAEDFARPLTLEVLAREKAIAEERSGRVKVWIQENFNKTQAELEVMKLNKKTLFSHLARLPRAGFVSLIGQ